MDALHTENMDKLFKAILNLESIEECYSFFEDVCTINELLAISQRFEVAEMLNSGKNYLDISAATGASTATISRVNKCLVYGNGYKSALKKLSEEDK
ncbi:MAG: TrpR YerC/YecD [Clostridia bacterium]|nr:TrpR YerC/YecD [Clostridia bacterium]